MGSSDELMTDDDFEKLLDELDAQKATQGNASEEQSVQPTESMESAATSAEIEENELEIILDPSVMIGQAGELHERLCSLLNEPAIVSLQAGEVNVIDTANMQMLFAFARDRREKDLVTRIRSPSESFVNTANCLGMLDVLAVDTTSESLA